MPAENCEWEYGESTIVSNVVVGHPTRTGESNALHSRITELEHQLKSAQDAAHIKANARLKNTLIGKNNEIAELKNEIKHLHSKTKKDHDDQIRQYKTSVEKHAEAEKKTQSRYDQAIETKEAELIQARHKINTLKRTVSQLKTMKAELETRHRQDAATQRTFADENKRLLETIVLKESTIEKTKTALAKLGVEHKNTTAKFDAQKARLAQIERDLNESQTISKRLETDLAGLKTTHEELRAKLKTKEGKLKHASQRFVTLTTAHNALEHDHQMITDELETTRRELAETRATLDATKAEESAERKQHAQRLAKKQTQYDKLMSNQTSLQDMLNASTTALSKTREELRQSKAAHDNIKVELSSVKTRWTNTQNDLQTTQQTVKKLETEITTLRAKAMSIPEKDAHKIAALEKEIARLKTQRPGGPPPPPRTAGGPPPPGPPPVPSLSASPQKPQKGAMSLADFFKKALKENNGDFGLKATTTESGNKSELFDSLMSKVNAFQDRLQDRLKDNPLALEEMIQTQKEASGSTKPQEELTEAQQALQRRRKALDPDESQPSLTQSPLLKKAQQQRSKDQRLPTTVVNPFFDTTALVRYNRPILHV